MLMNYNYNYRGGGGEGGGGESQILKKIDQNICSSKNDAKFIILKNSRYRLKIVNYLSHFMIFYQRTRA